MRLIDADALKEKVWDAKTQCGYVQVIDVGDIDDAPTIEPDWNVIWDTLSKVYNMKDVPDEAKSIIGDIMLDLEQPERPKGKWMPLQLSMAHPPYQCSCCFSNAPMVETGCLVNRHLEALLTDWCPWCGAKMEEGDTP